MNTKSRYPLFSTTLTAKTFFLFLFILGTSVHAQEHPTEKKGTVILLHGLGRTQSSMALLARHLEKQGYTVDNVSYPSTQFSIPQLTASYISPTVTRARQRGENKKIHFVTHSMGGILVRHYLAQHPETHIGKVVMLAPPNQGSEIIDTFGDSFLFRTLLAPAAAQLSTRPDSLPNTLPPLTCEVGIIAGTKSFNPLFSHFISGRDDGKVSVQSTTLPEMRDQLVLHIDHTFIMRNQLVIDQVGYFLERGIFKH